MGKQTRRQTKKTADWLIRKTATKRLFGNDVDVVRNYILNELHAPRPHRITRAPLRYGYSRSGSPKLVTFYLNGKTRRGLDPGGSFRKEVVITYTGSRSGDFSAANLKAGYTNTPSGCVWHHFHNYDASQNRGTLFLMQKESHDKAHTGGVKQYEVANGTYYG